MFDYIARPLYINKIRPYIGKSLIKVLIGQRRSGKSYLLYELMDLLKDEFVVGVDNIVYISKELAEFDVLKNDGDLLDYIKSRQLPTDAHKVLMIDEVQEIEQFEKVLRSLQAEGGWDIYISGSNANILSSELSTFLSGRYVEIEIFPLSYGEFLTFHKKPKGDESFIEYIKFGGLPYLIHLELLEEVVYPYLRNVYDSILLKDVVKRYRVRNVAFLQSLVSFLANNIGSIVSAKKIADYLLKERVRISPSVVINYLEFLNSVYFVFDVKRKAIGKKIFEVGSKHYFADLGIRHALFAYQSDDIAKILENLVYVQLRREGYEVFVGETEGKEIDFIAEKGGDKKYVQVAYLLNDQKTVEREFGNLLAIPDNYEKIVVSLDKYVGTDYKGIKVVNAMEFLTEFKL